MALRKSPVWVGALLALCASGCRGGSGGVASGEDAGVDAAQSDTDSDTDPYDEWIHLFDYDASAPLDVQVISTAQQDGIEIRGMTYLGALDPVPAYLVVPPGEGPFAGVVFLHWGGGSRAEFLDEAVEIAARGAIGLSIDAPWNRPDPVPTTPDEAGIQIIVDVRRGVDLLVSLAEVDPARLAFVGHSFGASRGGVLAGVEKRFSTFILMTGYGRPSVYDGASAPGAFMDGVYYVGHAAPSSLLFQFASSDEYITEAQALEFYDPASEPKEIQWYDAGHMLNADARTARTDWLVAQLGFTPP